MSNLNLMELMPKMLTGNELEARMTCLPNYSPEICNADKTQRLIALNAIADIYIPFKMTYEIYSKIYLSMVHSLSKKQTVESVKQGNENHKRAFGNAYNSILGGSDSFSVIGKSGIGKSTAIQKSMDVSGGNDVMSTIKPYANYLCINIQCPHDCSVKGLLLSILKSVDTKISTNYYEYALKQRLSIDSMIGTVSQVALNHILLIIIDECQNICRNKSGINLVSCITQIINSSGVSLCWVGLPQVELFFQQEMQLARRTVGLSYSELDCNDDFIKFCQTILSYQYVSKPKAATLEIIETLYQCSGGNIGLVVSLILESQQYAILTDVEELTKGIILETFQKRMGNVHDFVEVQNKIHKAKPKSKKKPIVYENTEKPSVAEFVKLKDLSEKAKKDGNDIVKLIKDAEICIVEVEV